MTTQRSSISLIFSALTHVGKIRNHNEDALLLWGNQQELKAGENIAHSLIAEEKGFLAIVADGMGGAEAGEVASGIAIEAIQKQIEMLDHWPSNEQAIRETLVSMALNAHFQIVNHSLENKYTKGMGTTLAMALFLKDKVHVAWCGDSRIYRYNNALPADQNNYEYQNLRLCTHDHSLVWEYVLKGKMSSEEARIHPQSNIISQSLGAPDVIPHIDTFTFKMLKNDYWIICSDGLNGMIPDTEIVRILNSNGEIFDLNNQLVNSALAAGGNDNITSILVFVKDVPSFELNVGGDELMAPSSIIETPASRPEMITQTFDNQKHPIVSDEKLKIQTEPKPGNHKSGKYIVISLLSLAILVFIYIVSRTGILEKDKESNITGMAIVSKIQANIDSTIAKFNSNGLSKDILDSLFFLKNDLMNMDIQDTLNLKLKAVTIQNILIGFEKKIDSLTNNPKSNFEDTNKSEPLDRKQLLEQLATIKNRYVKKVESVKKSIDPSEYSGLCNDIENWRQKYSKLIQLEPNQRNDLFLKNASDLNLEIQRIGIKLNKVTTKNAEKKSIPQYESKSKGIIKIQEIKNNTSTRDTSKPKESK